VSLPTSSGAEQEQARMTLGYCGSSVCVAAMTCVSAQTKPPFDVAVPHDALKSLRESATKGDAHAQYALGLRYELGARGRCTR
jgi:TPR repeat protein